MLIQMRTKVAKVLVGLLFSLLILSFAIWGIGDIFRPGQQATAVAEVGGIKITQAEFSRDLAREMNNLRQRFGVNFDVAQAQALGIVDQIIQQMITRALFEQQAEELRMIVGDEEVLRRIREQPVFRNEEGNFDRFRFEQVLRSNSLSEPQFIASLSGDIKRQHIMDAITGSGAAPRALAESLYAYQQERRVAETLRVGRDSLPELPAPSTADLEKIHDENADRFQAPEYRSVTLIRLEAEDLAKEVSVSEDDLRAEFEARQEEFRVPEKRAVEQIVYLDETAASDAKRQLDGGTAFAEVSRSTQGKDPVGLGLMSRDDMAAQLPVLADTAFALDAGASSVPVQSPFGWHILHVSKIEPGREPDFDAVRDELAGDLAMRESVDRMVEIANELDAELGSGATFEEAAELLQLELRRLPAIDAAGKDPAGAAVSGLPPLGEFSQTVFQTEPGQDSLLTETRDGNYFAVRVDGITPAVTRPLEEVRAEVAALWTDLEEDRLTRERAEALAKRIEDGEAMAAVAEAEGLSVTVTDPVTRQQTETAGLPS
ncbi:MAG: SurA N-terminal domain-containing protein, partial [Rhodospirillales bacterium]|nr:SurA N-terminal domain-containing protein [Rhodospirillales bacterium]